MRNTSVDWLKVVLAVMVVLLHLNVFTSKIPLLGFLLCNGFFRIAVPVFLIISGYYFDSIDSQEKLKKWTIRLGSLYLIWTLIYSPIWIKEPNWLMTIFFGYHHLWYLISALIGGSILYMLKGISAKMLALVAGVLFLAGYTFQTVGNLHVTSKWLDTILNTDVLVYRNFLFFGFPFLALGTLVKKFESVIMPRVTMAMIFLLSGILLAESYLHYRLSSESEHVDLLLSLAFVSPCIFLYVKNLKITGQSKNLALFSTGIYLIHTYVIKLAEYLSDHFPGYSFGKIGIFLITFSLTAIVVLFNRKLKYLL